MQNNKKVALVILDGWGMGQENDSNAVFTAKTPCFDRLWSTYPHTLLQAGEEYVGLPSGQIGGSEVGHSTIGAGKVIFQQLPRISRILENKDEIESLDTNTVFLDFINTAKKYTPHLIGLVSSGGVHSHLDHLLLLLDILQKNSCKAPNIHVITDGRDTPPQSAYEYVGTLLQKLEQSNYGSVATIIGRYFAMDRDNNTERVQKAINLYTKPQSSKNLDPLQAIENSYVSNINDEFIEPICMYGFDGIKNNEPLLFFNFRADRMRQLTTALKKELPKNKLTTFTKYHKEDTLPFLFSPQEVGTTLGEHLESLGKSQLLAAESEKYPHVTYFFNGGVEVARIGEKRHMSKSNSVKHDEKPDMQAAHITDNIVRLLYEEEPDFILVNFANADMVGHTGNFNAVVQGVEAADIALEKLTNELIKRDYICCITADHGNADYMIEPDGTPHTAHTLSPVPFIVYGNTVTDIKLDQSKNNGLSEIAGTVLDLMQLPKPKEGFKSLIISL
jgi:2,3-bisphosphoglycerate-independent phosphoglycerate mutase